MLEAGAGHSRRRDQSLVMIQAVVLQGIVPLVFEADSMVFALVEGDSWLSF